jgi:hypothetical protein
MNKVSSTEILHLIIVLVITGVVSGLTITALSGIWVLGVFVGLAIGMLCAFCYVGSK